MVVSKLLFHFLCKFLLYVLETNIYFNTKKGLVSGDISLDGWGRIPPSPFLLL